VLCPDSRSTDKHGGFQKLSSRNRSHLQRPQIKILFEVKEWFFTLAPARRMPQGGKKPAPASSQTKFKSICYRDAGRLQFDRIIITACQPAPVKGHWRGRRECAELDGLSITQMIE
jgi:hypothetical protein